MPMRTERELEICQDFGKNLAFIRRTLSWSQEKLALECGMTPGNVADIERGMRNVSLLTIFKLADALGINAIELINFQKST